MNHNIFPIFDNILGREQKETFLQQKSAVLWLTGLSGSGKSTIAQHLERQMFEQGFFAQVLDGDNIRSGINSNLGFSVEDRAENIRRIAEVSKLYLHSGIICINAFISPTKEIRAMAESIIGSEDFHEIHINTSLTICEQRDVKGLYKRARKGEIKNFTGIDAVYETPENPRLSISTEHISPHEAAQSILKYIQPFICITT